MPPAELAAIHHSTIQFLTLFTDSERRLTVHYHPVFWSILCHHSPTSIYSLLLRCNCSLPSRQQSSAVLVYWKWWHFVSSQCSKSKWVAWIWTFWNSKNLKVVRPQLKKSCLDIFNHNLFGYFANLTGISLSTEAFDERIMAYKLLQACQSTVSLT
jgi:hypothetical protein